MFAVVGQYAFILYIASASKCNFVYQVFLFDIISFHNLPSFNFTILHREARLFEFFFVLFEKKFNAILLVLILY